MVAYSATSLAENSDAVCFVDHDACIVFLCESYDFWDVGHITFHGEHAVGDDELDLVGFALLELLFKRCHVVVLVFQRLAE